MATEIGQASIFLKLKWGLIMKPEKCHDWKSMKGGEYVEGQK